MSVIGLEPIALARMGERWYLCATKQMEMEKYIEQIKAMLADNRIDEALAAAEQALVEHPGDATLLFWRGNIHMKMGHTRLAVSDYARAKNIAPDGPAAQAYAAAMDILNFFNHDLYNP